MTLGTAIITEVIIPLKVLKHIHYPCCLDGHFDGYLSSQPVRSEWRQVQSEADSSDGCFASVSPDVRGGHQMCVDGEGANIYMFGGWGGSKDLGDFWKFDIKLNQWTCLSSDASQVVWADSVPSIVLCIMVTLTTPREGLVLDLATVCAMTPNRRPFTCWDDM